MIIIEQITRWCLPLKCLASHVLVWVDKHSVLYKLYQNFSSFVRGENKRYVKECYSA